MIIHGYIIEPYIYQYYVMNFEDFSTLLAFDNWFFLLKEVEIEFLALNKVSKLRQSVCEKE